MHKFLLVIALLSATATTAFAQATAKSAAPDPSVEQTILRVTQDWLDADERHDRAALDKIIANDFSGTAPGGRTVSKQDILPAAPAENHSLSIAAQDVKVRVFGQTAVVTGRGIAKTPEHARQGELRFTVVFVKRADRWEMVAAHLSPVPQE
jgi:ketosteroid isomerase-like protein